MREIQLPIKLPGVPQAKPGRAVSPNGKGPKQRCGPNAGWQPSKEESRSARGKDHQKWPHAYFAELGLISLALTRAKAANARPETH